jgi:hypothetical protein
VYKGYPPPWRGWLLALSAVIVALIIFQISVGGGWVVFGILVVLVLFQWWLASYAKRQI